MDPRSDEIFNFSNGYKSDGDDLFTSYGQSEYPANGMNSFLERIPDSHMLAPFSTVSYETESPDDSDEVLKFLNMILVEENLEERPSMFHDPLALQATERSLYEVIGQEYPPSHFNPDIYVDQLSDSPESIVANSSGYGSSSNAGSSSLDPQWIPDPGEYSSTFEQGHQLGTSNLFVQENSQSLSSPINPFQVQSNSDNLNPLDSSDLIRNFFSSSESMLQFKKGMEKASKFLPTNNQLIIDLEQYALPQKPEDMPKAPVRVESDDVYEPAIPIRRRKHNFPEDENSENLERNSKQFAIHVEEVELSEYFDKVLLCSDAQTSEFCGSVEKIPGSEKTVGQGALENGSIGGKSQTKKSDGDGDTVDLRTLLISCAQAAAADDRRTAYELLKQIDQHSSPTGSAYQRLAHVFASGLRARLGATGNQLCASLTHRKMTAFEKLKAYQVFLCACPFKKLPIFFANKLISVAASEAHTLHIVDFGILYGFQWPMLIQHLSERPGGPPKLRITGIELPQPGFRPSERVEETGRRLAKYCERFGVPFEYQAIATQHWENIKLEDLKIVRDEVVAVNCLFRLGLLLDETVVVDSPRDKVLKLIRKMKPDIYVNAITNGSFNAPFFVTRFKEALFHYSALFDMFDATIPCDNTERIDFEQDFFGREVINIIACEGAERIERPETYKQWHARHVRAGFKPFPMNAEIMKKLRNKSATAYHKDFLIDEDGNWMLQGWKGRIICASSCWMPS